MRLKLDENISRHIKPILVAMGHDVLTADDERLLSRPDNEIAVAALHENRILLTLDLAFGDVRRFPPGSHPGIILFRPEPVWPTVSATMIVEFVRKHDMSDFTGCIVVVDHDRVRVRRPK